MFANSILARRVKKQMLAKKKKIDHTTSIVVSCCFRNVNNIINFVEGQYLAHLLSSSLLKSYSLSISFNDKNSVDCKTYQRYEFISIFFSYSNIKISLSLRI